MKKIALFEKVTRAQYEKDGNPIDYDDIKLPRRATAGSAGYDFFLPNDLTLNPGEEKKIATGIRVKISEGWVLKIYPRSSLGFKYKMALCNTVGIIDSDYYNALNEGHIMIKIVNNGDKIIELDKASAFAQGIFIEYGITIDDEATEERVGGFGSTNK